MCSAHTRVNPSILAEFPNEYVPSLHEINSERENCYHTSLQLFIHFSCVPLRSKISGCTLLEAPVAVGLPILGVTASQTSVALFQKLDFLNSGLI